MFDLMAARLTWIDVKFPGLTLEGERVENVAELLVELVDRDVFRGKFLTPADEVGPDDALETIQSVTRNWRGIADTTGVAVPFDAAGLARLVNWPGFVPAFVERYVMAFAGQGKEREGNSGRSADAGRAAGGRGRKKN